MVLTALLSIHKKKTYQYNSLLLLVSYVRELTSNPQETLDYDLPKFYKTKINLCHVPVVHEILLLHVEPYNSVKGLVDNRYRDFYLQFLRDQSTTIYHSQVTSTLL